MAGQLILPNDKPKVHLWFQDPLDFFSGVATQDHNKSNITYQEIVENAFIDHFKNFSKIKIKIINTDSIDKEAINIAPVVSLSISQFKNNLSSINQDLYNFCWDNDITLLQAIPRETIDLANASDVVDIVQNCIVNRGYSSKIVKIFYLAYDIIPALLPIKEYLIYADYFNVFLADYTSRTSPIPTFIKGKKRKYNFSLLAGQIAQRYYRILFLANAYEQKLLQSDFFHTTLIKDRDKLNYSINEMIGVNDYPLVKKHFEENFKHYVVNADGSELVDKSIYDDQIEYAVPKQVLDSYIHVVLETQTDIPCLSEKIYKPLMSGLIFIWHGPVNTLQYLESLGFKRYNYIDYSFDSHPNPNTRLNLLLAEIQRLKKNDLRVLTLLNQRTIEYNQNKFWEISSNMNHVWKHFK